MEETLFQVIFAAKYGNFVYSFVSCLGSESSVSCFKAEVSHQLKKFEVIKSAFFCSFKPDADEGKEVCWICLHNNSFYFIAPCLTNLLHKLQNGYLSDALVCQITYLGLKCFLQCFYMLPFKLNFYEQILQQCSFLFSWIEICAIKFALTQNFLPQFIGQGYGC